MIKRAEIQSSLLVVIDMQDRLLQAISNFESVLDQTVRMVKYAKAIDVPVLMTEQYRKGLGSSNPLLLNEVPESNIIEKVTFSAFDCPEFVKSLNQKKPHTLVIAGVESHICVCQTALAALELGYDVRILADAVGSRTEFNKEIGIEKMKQAGALIESTESILYEWLKQAGTPEFKSILPLVK